MGGLPGTGLMVNVQFRAEACAVQCMACTKAFDLPSTSATAAHLSFRYGMNEIRDGLLAWNAIRRKTVFEIALLRRLDSREPAHIYRKPNSGKTILWEQGDL
jgi:hypothetical protein